MLMSFFFFKYQCLSFRDNSRLRQNIAVIVRITIKCWKIIVPQTKLLLACHVFTVYPKCYKTLPKCLIKINASHIKRYKPLILLYSEHTCGLSV